MLENKFIISRLSIRHGIEYLPVPLVKGRQTARYSEEIKLTHRYILPLTIQQKILVQSKNHSPIQRQSSKKVKNS